MDISIIIVHYNTPELTKNCLTSVYKYTTDIQYEVIVVDNASTIHDANELKNLFPKIKLIKSPINTGFAGGNNLGIEQSTGKYILLLNSDTELYDNAITLSYRWMMKNPHVGVMSCRLNFPNGSPQSTAQRFPSIKYTLLELFRIIKLMPASYRSNVMLGAFCDHKQIVETDWVWGAFFIFPKEVLNKLLQKKLDDRFFMYAEDTLWCWQIKKLGYAIYYNPLISITHHMGGSNSPQKNELMQQNIEIVTSIIYSNWKKKILNVFQNILIKTQS